MTDSRIVSCVIRDLEGLDYSMCTIQKIEQTVHKYPEENNDIDFIVEEVEESLIMCEQCERAYSYENMSGDVCSECRKQEEDFFHGL